MNILIFLPSYEKKFCYTVFSVNENWIYHVYILTWCTFLTRVTYPDPFWT